MTDLEERKIAAAKADKYIGRDGSDPRPTKHHADVVTLAGIVSRAIIPADRLDGMTALSRITGLPRRTIEQMGDDIPF